MRINLYMYIYIYKYITGMGIQGFTLLYYTLVLRV